MDVPFLVAASQRRSVRRFVRLDCEVVRERGFRLLGRHAVDMSTTGMRFAALDDVEPGESVILAFRAPGTLDWVDAEARVARVVQGRRSRDYGPSIAVDFTEMPGEMRGVLRRQLLKCPPTIPKRELRIDYAASILKIGAS